MTEHPHCVLPVAHLDGEVAAGLIAATGVVAELELANIPGNSSLCDTTMLATIETVASKVESRRLGPWSDSITRKKISSVHGQPFPYLWEPG